MFDTDTAFEDEVRRTARLLWPAGAFGGAALVAGKERDGVFVTEEMVHLLECTTSRRLDKAKQDVDKLSQLVTEMRKRYPRKGIKAWFVTANEPTAEQREYVRQHGNEVVTLSFDQFRAMIIDAASYLSARLEYPFGSIEDMETKSRTELKDYIKHNLVNSEGEERTAANIADDLLQGGKFVVVGDYGAGKSTTLREIFGLLATRYLKRGSLQFPIHLNLRDHHGQSNPAEALERHARNTGYAQPHHLVRAWQSGSAVLLLDGFDEFATAGWTGQSKKLRDIRYQSMQLIREFVRHTPPKSGFIVAGRANFFDSPQELRTALGTGPEYLQVTLQDFTDAQVAEYLARRGWSNAIPAWLPSRPLLLGYLSAKGLLGQVLEGGVGSTPAVGWNMLLESISHREAEMEAGIDGHTVRLLIERLATKARSHPDAGMGPLSPNDIVESFKQVCGYPPDDRGIVLLQRLPGLGGTSQEDGTRSFVDQDMVDAARAGDVFRFVENPFTVEAGFAADWQVTMDGLGRDVAALRCANSRFNAGKLRAAIEIAGQNGEQSALTADLVLVAKEMGFGYGGRHVDIRNILLRDASFGDVGEDLSHVTYQVCLFQRLEVVTENGDTRLPRFAGCYVGVLEGHISQKDLPKGVFDESCVVDSFSDSTATTASILGLPLAIGAKVLLTILKKLYLQAGSGRKESALFRGLDQPSRRVVPQVLALLASEGLAIRSSIDGGTVWLPARSEKVRVLRLLAAPTTSTDAVLQEAGTFR